ITRKPETSNCAPALSQREFLPAYLHCIPLSPPSASASASAFVLARFNRARAARMTLPHFVCETPLFMPVGTQGVLKRLDVTSSKHSPVDGSPMLLTPEESIQIQNKIGADIIMALDDVVKTTTTGPRIGEAMYRTIRWIDRCIAAHQRPDEQNLFAIVQGGLDPVLRDICVKALTKRNLPGYAIGGLAGGEDKDSFWRVVAQCTAALPEDKPRYVMGVGYPLDIVVCSALGADMYDCVYPTRTARFGSALTPEGVLKLRHKAMAEDTRPVDPTCACMVCRTYSRAYIHSLVTKDAMGSQLLSYHNLYYMLQLSRDLHYSIIQGRFPEFVCDFLKKMVSSDNHLNYDTQITDVFLPMKTLYLKMRKLLKIFLTVTSPSGSAMPWRLQKLILELVSHHPRPKQRSKMPLGLITGIARAMRRKRPSSLDILSSKRAPRNYYKGKNCKPTGFHTRKGGYVIVPEKLPNYVVPDLTNFMLKPYVSQCPIEVLTTEASEPIK
ncbi:unnamed protein product, partial [Linum tenue]